MCGFGHPLLLRRGKIPWARGMTVYIRDDCRAFCQPKFESGCCEMLVFEVCGVRQNFYVFSLYRILDPDDPCFSSATLFQIVLYIASRRCCVTPRMSTWEVCLYIYTKIPTIVLPASSADNHTPTNHNPPHPRHHFLQLFSIHQFQQQVITSILPRFSINIDLI